LACGSGRIIAFDLPRRLSAGNWTTTSSRNNAGAGVTGRAVNQARSKGPRAVGSMYLCGRGTPYVTNPRTMDGSELGHRRLGLERSNESIGLCRVTTALLELHITSVWRAHAATTAAASPALQKFANQNEGELYNVVAASSLDSTPDSKAEVTWVAAD
jgi:hypothetical protein